MATISFEVDDATLALWADKHVWNGMGAAADFANETLAAQFIADAKAQAIRNAETDVTAAVAQAKADAAVAFDAAVAVSVKGVAVAIGAGGKLEPVKP